MITSSCNVIMNSAEIYYSKKEIINVKMYNLTDETMNTLKSLDLTRQVAKNQGKATICNSTRIC